MVIIEETEAVQHILFSGLNIGLTNEVKHNLESLKGMLMDGCVHIYFYKWKLKDILSSRARCLADLSWTPLYIELEKPEREKSVIFRGRCCWRLTFPSVLPSEQQNTERLTLLNLGLWLLWSWIILVLLKKQEDSMSLWGLREYYNLHVRINEDFDASINCADRFLENLWNVLNIQHLFHHIRTRFRSFGGLTYGHSRVDELVWELFLVWNKETNSKTDRWTEKS